MNDAEHTVMVRAVKSAFDEVMEKNHDLWRDSDSKTTGRIRRNQANETAIDLYDKICRNLSQKFAS